MYSHPHRCVAFLSDQSEVLFDVSLPKLNRMWRRAMRKHKLIKGYKEEHNLGATGGEAIRVNVYVNPLQMVWWTADFEE